MPATGTDTADQPVAELAPGEAATASADAFREAVARAGRPVVLRGIAATWPMAQAAAASDAAVRDYILGFDAGRRPQVMQAEARLGGGYFYQPGLDGFNFERREMPLSDAFACMFDHAADVTRPTTYLGSLVAPAYLPGLAEANRPAIVPDGVDLRLWIGNPSTVACHYDAFDNLACVIAGQRRFTLYPPDCIADMYVSPIDHTIAGQPVSLAAATSQDEGDHARRFPRFAAAAARRQVVDLAPGDALYIPKLWWHQVEALAPFNVMANYWWDGFQQGPDAPMLAMLFAMITLAERPEAERAAFRAFFDHFVFRPEGHPLAHLPEAQRGVLRNLAEGGSGQIRAMIMRALRG